MEDRMHAISALADETRREIVEIVAKNGTITSSEICSHFRMSPSAISQHLKVLKEAKLLMSTKDAQRRLYRLRLEGVEEMENWITELRNRWNKQLDAMERYALKVKKERRNERK